MPSTRLVVSQMWYVKVMTLGKLCSDTVQQTSYKKSKLHISELWFFFPWFDNKCFIHYINGSVCIQMFYVMYKIKSAISNPQKSFPEWWYDMTMCMNLP